MINQIIKTESLEILTISLIQISSTRFRRMPVVGSYSLTRARYNQKFSNQFEKLWQNMYFHIRSMLNSEIFISIIMIILIKYFLSKTNQLKFCNQNYLILVKSIKWVSWPRSHILNLFYILAKEQLKEVDTQWPLMTDPRLWEFSYKNDIHFKSQIRHYFKVG